MTLQTREEAQERLGQIASSGSSAETMDALKEALILTDSKVRKSPTTTPLPNYL